MDCVRGRGNGVLGFKAWFLRLREGARFFFNLLDRSERVNQTRTSFESDFSPSFFLFFKVARMVGFNRSFAVY